MLTLGSIRATTGATHAPRMRPAPRAGDRSVRPNASARCYGAIGPVTRYAPRSRRRVAAPGPGSMVSWSWLLPSLRRWGGTPNCLPCRRPAAGPPLPSRASSRERTSSSWPLSARKWRTLSVPGQAVTSGGISTKELLAHDARGGWDARKERPCGRSCASALTCAYPVRTSIWDRCSFVSWAFPPWAQEDCGRGSTTTERRPAAIE